MRWMTPLGMVVALVLAGCGTPESRIEKHPEMYGELSKREKTRVKQGDLAAGMSKDAVFLAWGRPDRVRRGVDAIGSVEKWIYLGHRTEMTNRYRPPIFDRYDAYVGGSESDYVTVPYVDRTATFRDDKLVEWEAPQS